MSKIIIKSKLMLVNQMLYSIFCFNWIKFMHSLFRTFWYVGYCWWLPPSPSSVPSLMPFPHFWQTDRDRSGPDLDCSSSKRNWLCSPKHGETELEQIQKELGDPDLRPDRFWWWMKLYMYYRNRMEMKLNGVSHPQ